MRMLLRSSQRSEQYIRNVQARFVACSKNRTFLRDERYPEIVLRNFVLIPQGRSPEIDGRTFFARGLTCRDAAPPFQRSVASTSDIPPMEFSPDERGGCEKLKSHQRTIIVSSATPQKLNNLQALTPTTSRSLFFAHALSLSLTLWISLFLSLFFCTLACPVPSTAIAADSRGHTCRQRRPWPKTLDEAEQRFVVSRDVYFR